VVNLRDSKPLARSTRWSPFDSPDRSGQAAQGDMYQSITLSLSPQDPADHKIDQYRYRHDHQDADDSGQELAYPAFAAGSQLPERLFVKDNCKDVPDPQHTGHHMDGGFGFKDLRHKRNVCVRALSASPHLYEKSGRMFHWNKKNGEMGE